MFCSVNIRSNANNRANHTPTRPKSTEWNQRTRIPGNEKPQYTLRNNPETLATTDMKRIGVTLLKRGQLENKLVVGSSI